MIRVVLAVMLAFAGAARAHEPALGVLDLQEVRPGTFIGSWTLEPTIGGDHVRLRVPPQCYLQMPSLECGPGGLTGSIGIDNLGADMSAVMLRIHGLDGVKRSYTLTSAHPVATVLGSGGAPIETWAELAGTYARLGIEHILTGADHLLFVFGLIWIAGGGWRLVRTISAFTVGHSISLAAAAFGLIGVPERPLNAAIALSIVFVGVELAEMRRGRGGLAARYPWAVAAGFGLVHGVGFAGALATLGIERALLPIALLSFNVGVEIGQLGFVFLVLALLAANRRLGTAPPAWTGALPAYGVGIIATFWFLGRLFVLLQPVAT